MRDEGRGICRSMMNSETREAVKEAFQSATYFMGSPIRRETPVNLLQCTAGFSCIV